MRSGDEQGTLCGGRVLNLTVRIDEERAAGLQPGDAVQYDFGWVGGRSYHLSIGEGAAGKGADDVAVDRADQARSVFGDVRVEP